MIPTHLTWRGNGAAGTILPLHLGIFSSTAKFKLACIVLFKHGNALFVFKTGKCDRREKAFN